MAMEIGLPPRTAQKLVRVLEPHASDRDLGPLLDLARELVRQQDEARAALPPWRKVVAKTGGDRPTETLECGHVYALRYSRDYVENHAKKRRCKSCAAERDRQAEAARQAERAARRAQP